MNRIPALSFALGLCLAAIPALAQDVKNGDLTIERAWARATPKGADIGAGYLEIRNAGAAPDRLTGGSADFASGVEVHEMKMDNGVMKMRQVQGGLEIPAHGSVKLAPSGMHLMFTGLKRPLVKGETIKATLTFEHAGPVAVDFPVQGIGAAGPAASPKSDDMKGMKM
jgi:copper(I)-binding protein